MKTLVKIRNFSYLLAQLTRYNLKIIFANKFVYFLTAAIIIFLFIMTIVLLETDFYVTEAEMYYVFLVPGLLLIFYPTAYGIQNDLDSRTIELLFGIPDYRYKVWLARLVIIYVAVGGILAVIGQICSILIVGFDVAEMTVQLMFPVFFLGSLAFMFSTLIRNGNGTAAVMVIIGMSFWVSRGFDIVRNSKWNIFHNPFDIPTGISDLIWTNIGFDNRLYLVLGTAVAILAGLYKLRYREKFV